MPAAWRRRSASTRVLVPSGAGVGSAIGFLRAPVGYEVVRSLYQRFSTFDVAAVNALLADMAAEADGGGRARAASARRPRRRRIAYMRYVGQGHEIPVPLPPRDLTARPTCAAIRAAYDTEYTRFYDRPVPGSDVEIMSYAVVVATVPGAGGDPARSRPRMRAPASTRAPARCATPATGEVADWPVHDRGALAPGAQHRRPGDHRGGRDLAPWSAPAGRRADRRASAIIDLTRETSVTVEGDAAHLAQIQRQIMWNRLIAVVEEQAQTMIRTAFSTTVREAGDLSAGIFDLQGRMLAQAVTGTPGHVNSMAESVGHFLREVPRRDDAARRPLHHQRSLARHRPPARPHRRHAGLPRAARSSACSPTPRMSSTSAGSAWGRRAGRVFEEGLYIPIVKCFDRGRAERDLLRLHPRRHAACRSSWKATSTRLCACNDAGAKRLVEMMDEFAMDSLDPLAELHLRKLARRATLAEIAQAAARHLSRG